MRLEAVLLDVDGTLLDTREFVLQAFEHTLSTLGAPDPGRRRLTLQIGRPLEAIYEEYAAGNAADACEIHRRFQGDHLGLVKAFTGVPATLAALRRAGLALAAVSSRSHRTMLPSLEAAGVLGYLDTVVAAEDARALKPDPAPLSVALERIGAAPTAAAMVGDTGYDVAAGRALGLVTVAATYGLHGDLVMEARPDHAIASFAELETLLRVAGYLRAGPVGP